MKTLIRILVGVAFIMVTLAPLVAQDAAEGVVEEGALAREHYLAAIELAEQYKATAEEASQSYARVAELGQMVIDADAANNFEDVVKFAEMAEAELVEAAALYENAVDLFQQMIDVREAAVEHAQKFVENAKQVSEELSQSAADVGEALEAFQAEPEVSMEAPAEPEVEAEELPEPEVEEPVAEAAEAEELPDVWGVDRVQVTYNGEIVFSSDYLAPEYSDIKVSVTVLDDKNVRLDASGVGSVAEAEYGVAGNEIKLLPTAINMQVAGFLMNEFQIYLDEEMLPEYYYIFVEAVEPKSATLKAYAYEYELTLNASR